MIEPRIDLPVSEMPTQWYNLAADLPCPPPLGPDGNPIGPEMLAPVFPMNLIEQEVSTERWIDIPEEVLEIYARWRPSPLRRAYALEKHLGTPAKIFYKDESVSPAGSHKPNTAVAQAWYNKQFGIKRLTTETGAGQWGSALAYAGQLDRPGGGCVDGAGQLRAEALPQDHDGDLGSALRAVAVTRDPGRPQHPRADARHPRQPRHRHLRGHRGRGHRPVGDHPLLAGQRAQPRHAPPDHHRARGQEAARHGGDRQTRCRHRLRRRRFEPRRAVLPLRRRQDPRRRDRDHPGRARGLPDAHPGALRLRPRRHRQDDAAAANVLTRPRLHPTGHPRRRAALPRHVAAGVGRRSRRADVTAPPTRSSSATRPRSPLPGPRASFLRPRPATPSPRRSTRQRRPRKRARRRRSSSTTRATV